LSGVEYIKFKSAELIEKLKNTESHMYSFKFVGRAQVNEWNNKFTPQIIIDEVDFEPISLESLF
jgi:hypothetical protein